ncbi:MAG: N-acetylneuraminate synthase family protein [bacterium]|nr:N-acetylneuraminate synthase family protein [bacterium]
MTRSIGTHTIGNGHPCFIVAEIGINHNGFVSTAKKLVEVAAKAGANAVKFQKRTVQTVYTAEELAKPRLIPSENGILKNAVARGVLPVEASHRLKQSAYEQTVNGDLKYALEFTIDEYREIASAAQTAGVLFFASPWDEASVDFLEQLAVPCHKVASACLTDAGLLNRIKQTGKPCILSTGGSTIDDINEAVGMVGGEKIILLHAVSTYPSQDADLNLSVMRKLCTLFSDIPIGWSGHEKGILPSIIAVALGACMVERHLTLDRRMWGSDHPASLEPDEFKEMVEGIRLVETVRGDGIKRMLHGEMETMKKLRRNHFR